jgi:4-amino-4-deoxy-L-arabinose transferase-like glycosyltransferase
LIGLAALALLPGLGNSARLTYHEAFVAQGSREILDSGQWMFPTISGLPWLEKPPLPWWLTATVGRFAGGVNETVARLPSAVAAMGLVLAVAALGTRHFGSTIGLLAGAIQATTAWTVLRGRLAEADVLLACLITWSIVAFDQIVAASNDDSEVPGGSASRWHRARWMFFGLLGATSLVKGIGFGAVIILSIVAGMVLWQRDRATLRRLWFPPGWLLAAVLALTWPILMIAWHGNGALALWAMHVTDRLSGPKGNGPFASEPWWEYVPTLVAQALPWTPLAIAGSYRSLRRALSRLVPVARPGKLPKGPNLPAVVVIGDRLLWVWTLAPLGLLTLATVKNAHYAIPAQVPWSIWAALALARIGESLRRRGWDRAALRHATQGGFAALALIYGLGLWLLAPWFDRRGVEWAFYESAGRRIPPAMSIAFLYDDWDRLPYEGPFGSIPHDLAVRLFYLARPACWHSGAESLLAHDQCAGGCSQHPSTPGHGTGTPGAIDSTFAVIGRGRDLPALEQLGQVEIIARGPSVRADRTYALFRVTPGETIAPEGGFAGNRFLGRQTAMDPATVTTSKRAW